VAFIQAVAAGTGLFIGGIPYAGPLTLVCLILCVLQAGISLVAIPVMIYAFSHFGTAHAVTLSVWLILIMFSDNILKPIFLSKGAPVPTLIIFLGSLGGFLLSGIIGLFTGAVILALGYRLFFNWIGSDEAGQEINEQRQS
jgi:predicted PurR-regulated permease PerM